MADDTETRTYTIEGPNDDADEVELPTALVDALAEGDPDVEVVADVTTMAFTSRAHMLVHHAEDDVDEDLAAAEETALDLFEERFGITYGEATGHQH